MLRTTALALAGVFLLIAAAALPPVGLVATQWDTEFIYAVDTDDTDYSFCKDAVHESPDVDGDHESPDVDYEDLTETGRTHFDRARTDGRYVVEPEAAAPDFQFTDDHVARGTGCYAVHDDGQTYALRTYRERHRIGPPIERWSFMGASVLLVVGAASILVAIALTVKRRLS